MIDKTKGTGGGLEDDSFDVEEFSDSEFDEQGFDEGGYIETHEDSEFSDDEFEGDEWQDEESGKSGKKAKKEKNLYTGGGGEKKSLSFNTIVIIGAVVVGGAVMAFTVMNKTAEQEAGQKGTFQSMLDISGVMDGTLFGEKEEQATPEQKAAQEKATQQQGFLNNPDVLANPDQANAQPTVPAPTLDNANPPQPTPIAPSETVGVQPLTPMPGDTPSTVAPRGPNDGTPDQAVMMPDTGKPATIDTVPLPETTQATSEPIVSENTPQPKTPPIDATSEKASTSPAKDILEQALENRQRAQNLPVDAKDAAQKDTGEKPFVTSESDIPGLTGVSDLPPVRHEGDKPTSAAGQKTATATTPIVPSTSVVPTTTATTGDTKNLESKVDDLLKRMDQIESELNNVKGKDTDLDDIRTTVNTLKKDVGSLKDKPSAPIKERVVKSTPSVSDGETFEPVTKQPVAKKKVKPAAKNTGVVTSYGNAPVAAAAPAGVSSRWELRAAQPGRAWISKKGERDMQTVEVGGNLPGVGTITAITYQNNRWTVYGTQGQIQQ